MNKREKSASEESQSERKIWMSEGRSECFCVLFLSGVSLRAAVRDLFRCGECFIYTSLESMTMVGTM